jgi:hypothetical protein
MFPFGAASTRDTNAEGEGIEPPQTLVRPPGGPPPMIKTSRVPSRSERKMGFEPMTLTLEGRCSTT